MSRESDEWLMGQVQRGDRDHLEPLVCRYASPILTFIQRMIGDRHRAEELFQEVFLAVWQRRGTYRLEKPFRNWLYAIAANRCRAEFRKAPPPQASSGKEALDGASDGESGPQRMAELTEEASMVEAAVARLPVQQRTVVVLRIWNQLSFAEIADAIDLAEGTVRSHMHLALKSLRERLKHRLAPTS